MALFALPLVEESLELREVRRQGHQLQLERVGCAHLRSQARLRDVVFEGGKQGVLLGGSGSLGVEHAQHNGVEPEHILPEEIEMLRRIEALQLSE